MRREEMRSKLLELRELAARACEDSATFDSATVIRLSGSQRDFLDGFVKGSEMSAERIRKIDVDAILGSFGE